MGTFDPIKKVTDAENTTRKVNLNLMSFEKSVKNCFNINISYGFDRKYLFDIPTSTSSTED